jgi:hypothetical protein
VIVITMSDAPSYRASTFAVLAAVRGTVHTFEQRAQVLDASFIGV